MASKTSVVEFSLNLRCPRPYGDIHDLHTDVLEAICGSITDTHDLLSMSLTCSMMWRIAMRQLLMTHTIRLASRTAIRGFRLFIVNHEATCAHHIRFLVIPEIVWIVPEITRLGCLDHVSQLMDVLDRAVNLRSLELCLDAVHAEPARIWSAFARMSALRHLSLVDLGLDWASHALSALRSPLQTLCVGGGDRITRLPPPPGGRFLQAISRFSTSSTLTTLLLDRIPMYDNSFLDLPRFPSVRSLTIAQPLEREPRLYPLLYLFPCLNGTLRLRLDFSTKTLRLFSNSDHFIAVREENRRAQEASRWTMIDRLDCDSGVADMLALQCAVRHLTIDSFDLRAIVGIQPKHLVVNPIALPFYISPIRWHRDLAQIPAAGPCLTHIVLITSRPSTDYSDAKKIHIYNKHLADSNWDASFERLIQMLSLFKNITHARLVFHCHNKDPCEAEADEFMREMRQRTSASHRDLAHAPQLLAACPKLRYFFVTAAGRDDTQSAIASQRRWIHDRAWRAVGFEEGGRPGDHDAASGSQSAPLRRLEELSGYVARRVIEAEDLGLPEEWERKLAPCMV